MKAYYIQIGATKKESTKSMIDRITIKMVKPEKASAKPRLRAKAAETRTLVGLLPQLCAESYASLGPRKQHLRDACTFLHNVYKASEKEPRQMSEASCNALHRQERNSHEAPLEPEPT